MHIGRLNSVAVAIFNGLDYTTRMNKITKSETGFGLVEIIIILVVTVVTGLVSAVTYQQHHTEPVTTPYHNSR
jgi:hypothetical protein